MALPQPKGKQLEVLDLKPEGHNVVLGTAGSGKTTLAIYRAIYLATLDDKEKVMLVSVIVWIFPILRLYFFQHFYIFSNCTSV